MAESFQTTHRFFDNKNYPRGFARHGDFTIKEAQILEKLGNAFYELDMGKRDPITDEERAFLEVCREQRQPISENEKIWMKYLSKIRKPKRFHTLSGGKPQLDTVDDFVDSDD